MFISEVNVRRHCCVRRNAICLTLILFLGTIPTIVYFKNNVTLQRLSLRSVKSRSLNLSGESVPEYRASDSIQNKLAEAESKWLRKKMARTEADQSLKSDNDLIELASFSKREQFWNLFDPGFECPYALERVGRKTGDGGKWICGFEELAKKPKCIVYSFGIYHESTFEEDIANRTKCKIHMFEIDQKIEAPGWAKRFPGRVTYTKLGIGPENTGDMRTLKTLMDTNGDNFADILKLDVEGWEWRALDRVLVDYPGKLPFGQMQIEVHLHHFKPVHQYVALRNFWFSMEKVGLRTFYKEPNQNLFREFSFLNIRADMFKLQEDFNSGFLEWTMDPKYYRKTTHFLSGM